MRLAKMLCLAIGAAAAVIIGSAPVSAQSANSTTKIGVLAFRGTDSAVARWKPLTNYLTETLGLGTFSLTPVTLISAPGQIEAKEIDFLITNPGHYVTLSETYNLSALATLERRQSAGDAGLFQYGSVIFVRKDSAINSLADLKGKKVAAVSPQAFGGFQMAWREFKRQDIDPFVDFQSIAFMGFPQDAIVEAVISGNADAGIGRSGLLESLAREKMKDIHQIRVLQGNTVLAYPHQISSQLYPEWPFSSLPGTSKILRENLVSALMETQNPLVIEKYGLQDMWSAPLSYGDVRRLIRIYDNRNNDANSGQDQLVQFLPVVLLGFLMLGTGLILAFYFSLRKRAASPVLSSTDEVPVSAGESETIALFESLTRRENQILGMICLGKTSKEIALDLGISPKTVEYHRANLLHKTQMSSTPQLVQVATQLHLDQVFSPGTTR